MLDPKDYERVGLFRMDNGRWSHPDGDEAMERILAGTLEEALREQKQRDARAQSLRQAGRF
jgi:hypothetical protein